LGELDGARQQKAKAYARTMRRLAFLELGLSGAFVLVLLFTSLATGLRDLLDFPGLARVALYFATLLIAFGILSAPLSFYGGFVVPRRFGLLRQSLRGWLADGVKRGALGLVLGAGVMVCLFWLMGRFPDLWWLFGAAFLILLGVAMTNLAPVVIIPLFYKLEPLGDAGLRERLERLAERAKTKVRGVSTMNLSSKATTGNAALVGLGNTRRIILGDTVVDQYSAEEIEVIVAHELGHHVHRDIAKLIAMQSLTIVVGFFLGHLVLRAGVPYFGFEGISDVAALPLLAGVFGLLVVGLAPLTNAYSRRIEGAADGYALTLTGNAEGFITMMTGLTNQNLSEAEPSRWVEWLFYDHPPFYKRVARARDYEKGAG
jgi:STE24 endopeptidase